MRPASLGFALLALLILTGCDTAETRPAPPYDVQTLRFDTSLLVGTWDLAWEGSYWGQTEGPAAPPARVLIIRDDGTFTYLTGGEVTREGTYVVGQSCADATANAECRDTLELGWYSTFDWQGVSEEWLVFDSRPLDGGLSAYRRR